MITELEEPLPNGGSCLLGHINLSEMVENEFEDDAYFNFDKFKDVVKEGVIYLNEVLEEGLKLHPLEEQRESVRKWRQIGLGVLGLADMFIKMKIKYGSEESLKLIDKIGYEMANMAIQQSALLAKEKGTYPAYKEDNVLNSEYLNEVAFEETIDMVKKYGLRNSQLMTIAPTGSTSNLLGVSGGVEPIFALRYTRKTESLKGDVEEYDVYKETIKQLMDKCEIYKEENLPDYVVTAHDLDYKNRIDVQSIWQKYIDASISSTVNLSNDASVEDVKDLYMYAWEKKLKGITVFREGCARAGILKRKGDDNDSNDDKSEEKKENLDEQDFIDMGICPECKSNLYHTGGCLECPNCGYSPCSV